MASCITSFWDPNNTTPRVQLTVTQQSSDSTSVTLSWKFEYIASYAVSTSVKHNCKAVVNGSTVYEDAYSINGKTGTNTIASGTKKVNKGTSKKTVSFSCSMDFDGITWSGKYSGSNKTASGSITIAALDTYTVSYNANGGSGAPSSQTKVHGTDITLSTTVPTRTGYSFQGWATSASSSTVAYESGDEYSANDSITLYAVWKANTYTVSYNANGGSGAPSSQTKTYGKTLTLSTTKPTRANYIFVGWGVSASSTTASYQPGGSYTANSKITLYAVWTLGYTKPRITNMDVDRCDSSGNVSDTGTSILVVFDWATDESVSSINIAWKLSAASDYANSVAVSASGTSGSVRKVITSFTFAIDSTYDIRVIVTDSGGNSPSVKNIGGSKFSFDAMPEDKGVALGKAAEVEGLCDIAYQTRHLGGILQPILEAGADFDEVKTPNTYTLKTVTSNPYRNCPFESGTGILTVESSGDAGQIHQIATYCSKTVMARYERFFYQESWGDWFTTYYDSGWKIPTLGSDFELYNTNVNSKVQYRRFCQMVEIRGAVKPTRNDIGGTTEQYTIFELPESFRPSSRIALRMQGSNVCTWLLTITTEGLVQFSRHSDNTDMINADTGTWLPFQATFFVD